MIGRWGTIDPLSAFASSWTPYRYGFDNPISFIDSSGKSEEDGDNPEKLSWWPKKEEHKGSDGSDGREPYLAGSKDYVKLPHGGGTKWDPNVTSTYDAVAKYGEGAEDISGQTRITKSGTPAYFGYTEGDWYYTRGLPMAAGNQSVVWDGWKGASPEGLRDFASGVEFSAYFLVPGGAEGTALFRGGEEAVELGTHLIYRGIDIEGVVRYVGITGREALERFAEHLNAFGTGKELLRYEVVEGLTGLSRMEAKIQEQMLINEYGLANLLNKINSIAPKNWVRYGITP